MDKIICFGKNYTEHMLELGDKPVTRPVIFLKPPSILKQVNSWSDNVELMYALDEPVHYECELVLRIDQGGFKLSAEEASQIIGAYTVGLDMTYRDKQRQLKDAGHPWEIAKVFPDSCVIGPWLNVKDVENYLLESFSFSLDNELKQQSTGNNMLMKPAELISYASSVFPLCAGDIIFTGTPVGVGPIKPGSSGNLRIADKQFQVNWTKTI